MTDHEKHPRKETETLRRLRRKELRTWAEKKLMRHGQAFLDGPLRVTDVGIRFRDGSPGHLTRIKGRISGKEVDVVKINMYHTEDPLGPMTQYTSDTPGHFSRSDLNPSASGTASSNEGGPDNITGDPMVELAMKAVRGAISQTRNAREGVDGLPITAQESQEVLQKCRTATVDRQS